MNNTPENSRCDIEFIARRLKARKKTGRSTTVLFLGSRSGNLFRRNSLADLLKDLDRSGRTFLGMTQIEQFHVCCEILQDFEDNDIHDFISAALKDNRIELADICMAELMKQGFFNFIITTNIGNELEDAFRQSEMIEHSDFEIVAPEQEKSLFEMREGLIFKLIKISGNSYSKIYSIGNRTVGSDKIYLDHYPRLRESLEQIKEKNMLMVGFDSEWDGYIVDALLPRKGGELWYVNEEPTKADSPFSFLLQGSPSKRLESTIGSYELFFMNLCWHVLGRIPSYPATLDKIDKMQGSIYKVQNMQQQFQENLGTFTKVVNQRFEDQENIMNGIKDDIKTLITRPNPNNPSSSKTSATSSTTISGLQEDDEEQAEKNSEEKEL